MPWLAAWLASAICFDWPVENDFNALLGWLRLFAVAVFMIILGLYIGKWWFGLLFFEKVGQKLWRYISPVGKSFLPLKHLAMLLPFGFYLGLASMWPCLLYVDLGSGIGKLVQRSRYHAGVWLRDATSDAVGMGANFLKKLQQADLFRQLNNSNPYLRFLYWIYGTAAHYLYRIAIL